MAIQEWIKIKNGHQVSLERALSAFDMFVLREQEGDFDDVGQVTPIIKCQGFSHT